MRRPEDRPLPRRLAALPPGTRLLLAAVGILVGVGLMVGGLKLLDDEVNRPAPTPSTRTTLPGN